jgi:hypothetical protein
MDVNVPVATSGFSDNAVASILDSTLSVTDVRMESM